MGEQQTNIGKQKSNAILAHRSFQHLYTCEFINFRAHLNVRYFLAEFNRISETNTEPKSIVDATECLYWIVNTLSAADVFQGTIMESDSLYLTSIKANTRFSIQVLPLVP